MHLPQLLRMLVQREEQVEERYQREDEHRQKEVAERECMEVTVGHSYPSVRKFLHVRLEFHPNLFYG